MKKNYIFSLYISLLFSALLMAQQTYTTQTGNFNATQTINTNGSYFAGTFNNGTTELGTFANGNGGGFEGNPGVVAFRTFTSNGSNNTTTSRVLQMGDQFTITGYVGSSTSFFDNGTAGIAFKGNTNNTNFSDFDMASRLRLQINKNGNWFVNASSNVNGFSTPGQDVTLTFKLITPNRVNVTIAGSNGATTQDVILNGTLDDTIESFAIWNQTSGNGNDMFWKNASLTATGTIDIGGSNNTFNISSTIKDGLEANSSTIIKVNNINKIGTGTVTFSGINSYTGATTVAEGTLILQESIIASDVTVNSGTTLIINGADVKLKSLTVNSGGTVIINKNKALTLTGNLINNGTMNLQSDSDEYSSLIVNGTSTGIVNYSRHVNITAAIGENDNNDLISAPVTGQEFGVFAMANPNIVQNPTNNTQKLFGPFNKMTGTYQIYNTVDNDETVLDAATGYRAASTDDGTFTFSGTVNTGSVPKAIFDSGPNFAKWNLIGNPYPSYINLLQFLTTNNAQFDSFSSGVYGYDGDASDGYVIWNLAFAQFPGNENIVMTPGQGFLVASKTDGGTVTFNPSMRSIGTSDDFINGRNADGGGNNGFLRLDISNGTDDYTTDFYFNDNSTLGLDPGYDASVFGNNAPAFSIYSQLVEDNTGVDLAIQSIGFSSLSDVIIPLGINVSQGQQVTVSITTEVLPPSTLIILEDNLENTFTQLQSGDYTFTANTTLNDVGRFFLRFTDDTLSTAATQLDQVQVFVNMQSELLHVKGLIGTTMVNLYDIQGRLVLSSVLDENTNISDVSSLKSGVYVVQISNKKQYKNQKIIIR